MKAEYVCEYCGLVGETIDHLPPVSIRPTLIQLGMSAQYPFIEVRACHECNNALSDLSYWTVEERREYIATWLRRRYKKFLLIPEWTTTELDALDDKLRALTVHGLNIRRITIQRIERAESDRSLLKPSFEQPAPRTENIPIENVFYDPLIEPVTPAPETKDEKVLRILKQRMSRLKAKIK